MPLLAGMLMAGAAMQIAAPSAWAGASFGVGPAVPPNVTVGQTGVGTSIVIRNISFNGAGESNFDTDSFQLNDVTLVASCGSGVSSPDCPAGFLDPGVIVPAPLSGSGLAGTACGGRSFAISNINPAQGKYRFTPNATVILSASGGPAAAATCTINFTSSILKAATIDSSANPGVQTDQKAFIQAEVITVGSVNFGLTATGTGTTRTTVARNQPAITTIASPSTSLGTPLTDGQRHDHRARRPDRGRDGRVPPVWPQ